MRRDIRKHEKSVSDKIIMYSMIGGVALTVILIGLLMYSKNLRDDVRQGTIDLGNMSNITNNTENTESASTEMGKSVEEAKNEINATNSTNASNTEKQSNTSNTTNKIAINTSNITNTNKTTSSNSNVNEQDNLSKQTNAKAETTETKKELSFSMPVEGEISKDFAKDSLVYSETLKEWVTHMGIDIKAEKTTVVKAAESGTIKSIKNDPRYGLTVVIDHGDGTSSIAFKDGHGWDEGTVIVEPTCGSDGTREYHCACGKGTRPPEPIPKTNNHTWSAYNAQGDRTCSVCNARQHDASKVRPAAPVYNISGKPAKVKVKAAGGRKLTVTWKKPNKSKLKQIKGLYIEVAADSGFKNIIKTKKVNKSKTSFTFKKLKKGTKYYVRVRFYKGSQISRWSAVKNRKVK